jgi:ribosomal protein S18 acetylase RimI-like enzyme
MYRTGTDFGVEGKYMPKIQIRPAVATDIPFLMDLDHSCTSDYVWQMEQVLGENQAGATFREIRLPRSVLVSYPRATSSLADEWSRRAGMLLASVETGIAGYIRSNDNYIPQTTWITDLAVIPAIRRQGVGSALILAVQAWASERGSRQIVLETNSKNIAGIRLAQKLGFDFCGYNDHYYLNQDIALFFGRAL